MRCLFVAGPAALPALIHMPPPAPDLDLRHPDTAAAPVRLIPPGGPTDELTCYPNCDFSTTPPCLNISDFVCFMNSFAAGRSYANCDYSTATPILNVNDFTCFINTFGSGCGGGLGNCHPPPP